MPAILPSLDFKTLILTVSLLTLMLSALLFFARVYAQGIAGIGHLAAGNLAIGLGMIAILTQLDNLPRYLIPGIALLAFGNGLYINGIQLFFSKRPHHFIPVALALGVVVIDLVFVILGQNLRAAILGNTSIHLLANAGCAWLLIRHGRHALRSPYGFTALLFLIMALLMLVRMFVVALADPAAFQSVFKWPISKFTFLWAGVFQLCITFGFVLMLHYRMAERLRSYAAHDWLTGALNRRYLEESALRMVANCRRANIGLAVLLFDLDHFKKINDRFGHQTGDEVIKCFAAIVQSTIRTGDLFGRYGGEEFCIMLPKASEEDAKVFAERIRITFQKKTFTFRGETFHCSVSAGVSDVTLVGSDVERLIAAADQALYQSKAFGRNRTTVYSALQATVRSQPDAPYPGAQGYQNALS